MIIKIMPFANDFRNIISYNEKKIEEGSAALKHNGTGCDSLSSKISVFENVLELNQKLKDPNKNVYHIVFSFHPDEKINDDTLTKIVDDYTTALGFNDAPQLLYHHYDHQNQHAHLVVSGVDYNGKRTKDYKINSRTNEARLSIIKKHGLKLHSEKGVVKASQTEQNAVRHKYINAIKKAHKQLPQELSQFVSDAQLKAVLSDNKLADKDLATIIPDNTKRKELIAFLDKNKLVYKPIKGELLKNLTEILKKSSSQKHYEDLIKANGLYVRPVYKNGVKHYVYGTQNAKGAMTYFSDKKLPTSYKYSHITNHFNGVENKQVFSKDKQMSYIKNQCKAALKVCKGMPEYVAYLEDKGIKVDFIANKGGVYGITYTSKNVSNPFVIKGSEAGVSYNDAIKAIGTEADKALGKDYTNEKSVSLSSDKLDKSSFEPSKAYKDALDILEVDLPMPPPEMPSKGLSGKRKKKKKRRGGNDPDKGTVHEF